MPTSLDRRTFLRVGLSGAFGVSVTGVWHGDSFAQPQTDERSTILLWMNGGPSQLDTFDPKPGHANGGDVKAIRTTSSDISISQHLPQIAQQMQHLAVVRSVSSKEGSHERGRLLMHTGYLPTGTAPHPGFGAIVSAELGSEKATLPNFVSVNLPSVGPGLLGMQHAAFHVPKPEEGVPDALPPEHLTSARLNRRLNMLGALEGSFAKGGRGSEVLEHRAVYEKSLKLMNSPALKAFDLNQEKAGVREAYGKKPFGQGCLLARRLIEAGVRSVEVTLDGWDTHINNAGATKKLLEMLDPAMARLIAELAERNRLDKTLVAWLGEFGRTPKINVLGGRDHWPKGWSAVFAGAGIKGGRVLGRTSADGTEIVERPVTVPDLFASMCQAVGIDPAKEHVAPNGRPLAITDKGTVIKELFA